jgi:predicted metal-dependent peptidase
MIINPEFWKSISIKHKVGVLMHELDHIIMGHLLRGHDMDIAHKHMNIAADLAINQHNRYLQDMANILILDKFNEKYKVDMEPNREMEYYARKLLDDDVVKYVSSEELADMMSGDHSMWNDSDIDEDTKKQIMVNALEEAANSTQSGNIPGEALTTINKHKKPYYNWKRVLAKFIARTQNNTTKVTRNRRNRRFALTQPGKRQEVKMHIVCCIDTSGSVSDDMLGRIGTELCGMVDKRIRVTIIEADHDIQRVYEMDRKGIQSFKGRGGTAYTPAIKKAEELKPDAILYFTDGDRADVPDKVGVPFLWVLTTEQDKPGNFGKVLRIPA